MKTPLESVGASTGRAYSFLLVGDTHYDVAPASVYHADYNEPVQWLNDVQRAEFARNGEMWAERCPRMIRAAARAIRPDTSFALQIGDVVQGDCGNPDVHKKMLADALSYFKREFSPLPMLTVTGNHDIRGTGAKQAFHEFYREWMTKETGRPVPGGTFALRHGPDVFLFVDFNEPDLDVLRQTLDDAADVRHLFLVTHAPAVPLDAPSRWFLLGGTNQDELRREFYGRLLRRHAIVLAGHTHTLAYLRCENDRGRVDELVVNSVWSDEKLGVPDFFETRPAHYGDVTRQKGEDEKFGPLLAEYKPDLKEYAYGHGAGYTMVQVSDAGVVADFYGGDSASPARRFQLR